jgi:ATP-dependent Lon protease
MYYTPSGGDIMFVEAVVRQRRTTDSQRDGLDDVSLILTGQLGEVMRESARAALTYVTVHHHELGISVQRPGSLEVHVHVPAGAIPKDGPSAGVTIAVALASALSGRKVRKDVAMTGEITLRGRVLPIGGVKEKVLGAHRAGITDVILPEANSADIQDIPGEVRGELIFHFVSDLAHAFNVALLPEQAAKVPHAAQ